MVALKLLPSKAIGDGIRTDTTQLSVAGWSMMSLQDKMTQYNEPHNRSERLGEKH